jgi:hypothetical protein
VRTYKLCARILQFLVAVFKKGLAWSIFHFVNFLNTFTGKICASVTLACLMFASVYYAHIILFPLLVSTFGALWRRVLVYIIWRKLSSRRRKWIRDHWTFVCTLCKRKWGALNFWGRLVTRCLVVVAVGMILLHYLHIWSVAVYITAIIPVPVFLEIYLGQKLPKLIVAFVQRQGLGKIVFDGGWQLVPKDWRRGAKLADRAITKVIKRPNKEAWRQLSHTLDRVENIRAIREQRKRDARTDEHLLEKDLAALD